MRLLRIAASAVFLCVFAPGVGAAEVVYARDIAPILAARCTMCHAGTAAPLGLRLDTLDNVLKGSQRSPVVKAGDPRASELIRRIKGTSLPRMPMTGPPYLSEQEIGIFESWVAGGLKPGSTESDKPVAASSRPAAGEPVTYMHVAPIFATRCAKCHTDNGLMGPPPEGFRLTSYESTVSAADRARVVPANPGASELLRRIRGQSRPRMPFDGPPYLNDDEIRLIEQWIAQGARDAAGKPASVPEGARLRLHGELTGQWSLDGLPLDMTRGARIDKSPHAGDYVEVRARVGASGTVVVERLRRR